MKRSEKLQNILAEKIAKILPGGYYEEYANTKCAGKIIMGPHVAVYTTLEKVPGYLKQRIEQLLNEYLCDVKFVRREPGSMTFGITKSRTWIQLTYRKTNNE